MSFFKDATPEQRKAMAEKSAATRRANKLAKASAPDPLNEDFAEPEIVYGEVVEAVPDDPADDEPLTPFELFLAGLDRETCELLSREELWAIFNEQVAAAKAEKKAAKKKQAGEQAKYAARMEAGLIPRATREETEWLRRQKEIVRGTITLPPSGDHGEVPDIGLRIDQKIYLNGHTYPCTRSEWESRREMMYRIGQHELTFKGHNIAYRQWVMGQAAGGVNPHIPLNADGSLA